MRRPRRRADRARANLTRLGAAYTLLFVAEASGASDVQNDCGSGKVRQAFGHAHAHCLAASGEASAFARCR
jgi:hypothetical protein